MSTVRIVDSSGRFLGWTWAGRDQTIDVAVGDVARARSAVLGVERGEVLQTWLQDGGPYADALTAIRVVYARLEGRPLPSREANRCAERFMGFCTPETA
jgi:hypothetical protein